MMFLELSTATFTELSIGRRLEIGMVNSKIGWLQFALIGG
jgi:hypothetical protein